MSLQSGQAVTVAGLLDGERVQLNGKTGTLVRRDADTGRWRVRMHDPPYRAVRLPSTALCPMTNAPTPQAMGTGRDVLRGPWTPRSHASILAKRPAALAPNWEEGQEQEAASSPRGSSSAASGVGGPPTVSECPSPRPDSPGSKQQPWLTSKQADAMSVATRLKLSRPPAVPLNIKGALYREMLSVEGAAPPYSGHNGPARLRHLGLSYFKEVEAYQQRLPPPLKAPIKGPNGVVAKPRWKRWTPRCAPKERMSSADLMRLVEGTASESMDLLLAKTDFDATLGSFNYRVAHNDDDCECEVCLRQGMPPDSDEDIGATAETMSTLLGELDGLRSTSEVFQGPRPPRRKSKEEAWRNVFQEMAESEDFESGVAPEGGLAISGAPFVWDIPENEEGLEAWMNYEENRPATATIAATRNRSKSLTEEASTTLGDSSLLGGDFASLFAGSSSSIIGGGPDCGALSTEFASLFEDGGSRVEPVPGHEASSRRGSGTALMGGQEAPGSQSASRRGSKRVPLYEDEQTRIDREFEEYELQSRQTDGRSDDGSSVIPTPRRETEQACLGRGEFPVTGWEFEDDDV